MHTFINIFLAQLDKVNLYVWLLTIFHNENLLIIVFALFTTTKVEGKKEL